MRRNLLLALTCSIAITAAAQPTWRFHLAFEDGTGARDTIWMVYDTTATLGSNPWPGPNVDTLLGEGPVDVNDGAFHVFLTNAMGDTTQTNAFPYSQFPNFDGTVIDAINWIPPMTITWDTSLFHAPYLPYDQGSFGIAVMNGIAFSAYSNDPGMGFGMYNMLISDSVTIDFLSDYLFSFPVYFDAVDNTGISVRPATEEPLRIWPNPATDKIWLRPPAGYAKDISITNIAGRQILHQGDPTPSEALDISMLPPGVYFIRMLTDQNHIHHGTFEKIP